MKYLIIIFALLFSQPAFAHQDPDIAGYIEVEGGKIWYRLNGAEHLGKRPAIIVAHGGPGGTHRGNMSYVQFADQYPVILYDQLGSGKSSRPEGTEHWEVSRFIDEVDAIRSALKLDKVIMAGHSWGGTVAAEYALRQPDGLVGVILSSPLIDTAQWVADNDLWKQQLPKDVRDTLIKHEKAGTTDDPAYLKATEVFYQYHMCRKDPCPGANYREGGADWNPVLYEYMWGTSDFFASGTLKSYSIADQLPKITAPTLMVCGEFDEAHPRSCHKYANSIKNARTEIIPDAGHSTMRENESLYLEVVGSFIQLITNK